MAEATGTEITNTNTGILSRISGIFSNVKKLRSDPAVQKSVPLAFGIIVTFIGIVSFYLMQKPEMTTLFSSLPENEKSAAMKELQNTVVDLSLNIAEKLLSKELDNKEKQLENIQDILDKTKLN